MNDSRIIINPKQFNHYIGREEIDLCSVLYPTGFEHQYSRCCDFAKRFILSVTGEDYFKNIHISEDITYKRLKRYRQRELLKHSNPQMAIIPRIEYDYNRNDVDLYQQDLKTLNVNRIDESIIRDDSHKLYIGMKPRQIKIDFDIRIKLSTKSQQLALYDKLKIGLKNGSTQDIYEKSTFQIPSELVFEMYKKIYNEDIDVDDENSVKKIVDYINSHSISPVIYDMDLISKVYHFYIHIDAYNYHVNFIDKISLDEGERDGQIYTNYMIEFSFSILCPCPLFFYLMYSNKDMIKSYVISDSNDKLITEDENNNISTSDSIEAITIPQKYNNFDLYISTQITDVKKGDLELDINDIRNGLGFSEPINLVLNYCISRKINPNVFLYLLPIYKNKHLDVHYIWEKNKVIIKDIPNDCLLDFAIYVDKLYLNKVIADIKINNRSR